MIRSVRLGVIAVAVALLGVLGLISVAQTAPAADATGPAWCRRKPVHQL